MKNFIIVANAGRSGSTFLADLLRAVTPGFYIAHEEIPVQTSRPRQYNRAYDAARRAEVLSDSALKGHLDRFFQLSSGTVAVETGWTVYHLLPVFYHVFGDRLKVIVLHRDPWSVALSRANMGNYHRRTWYDDAHEVAPGDPHSIASEFLAAWPSMNHAERCLYWWFVVYKEIFEFLEGAPSVPRIEVASSELFNGEGLKRIADFCNFHADNRMKNAVRNDVPQFMRETFPIKSEFRKFSEHSAINDFARQRFGYKYDRDRVEMLASRYRLPDGVLPWVRHKAGYWAKRRRIGELSRSLT